MNTIKPKKLCIFTTYLSSCLDPQRKINYPKDFECVFYSLMIGCVQNDIDLFIFHDNSLSIEALRNNLTRYNKNIHLIQISPNTTNLSNNDYRFKIYLDNFHLSKNFTHVLFSDAGDVYVRKNPIDIMNDTTFYACQETDSSFSGFNSHYGKHFNTIQSFSNLDINYYQSKPSTPINAGVWGGQIDLINSFLKDYVLLMEDISNSSPKINCNNLLFNIMLKTKNVPIDSSIFSPFKRYLFRNNSFYIYHK
jgi:hypothetical protein